MEADVKTVLDEIKKLTLISAKAFFTVDEFCMLTSLSKETVYRLMRNNLLAYSQPIDSKRYISRKEYEHFMMNGHVPSISEILNG